MTLPPMTRRHVMAGFFATCAAGLATPRRAQAAPVGPVILTLSDKGRTIEFDLSMLDALPQRETVTATPWHEGRPRFSGPTLASVLDATSAQGTTLRIVALNDYAAEMPVTDARAIPVILATRIEGREISIRNKGPIFVIYPFDEQPELSNEVYFSRSVWQVARIEVLP